MKLVRVTRLLWVVGLGGMATFPVQAQTEVGSETCVACHTLHPPFPMPPHREVACEDCHGPGSLHVENGGDESLSMGKQPAGWVNERCSSCHFKQSPLASFAASAHGSGGLACVDCHRVHGTGIRFGALKAGSTELCLSCHGPLRSEFQKAYHHPVPEGAMTCVDCHNPHLEERWSGARGAAGTEENCLSCHSDKGGPFVFEHAARPVGSCLSCHLPHGSPNPKMLVRHQVQQLCLECHTQTPGLPGNSPVAFHDLRSPRFRNCTVCHREIHGSNASPLFLR